MDDRNLDDFMIGFTFGSDEDAPIWQQIGAAVHARLHEREERLRAPRRQLDPDDFEDDIPF